MSSEPKVSDAASHVASLQKLKSKDPEFYKYLEENDQSLLNFSASEDDDDDHTQLSEGANAVENSVAKDDLPALSIKELRKAVNSVPNVRVFKQLALAFKKAVQQTDNFSNNASNVIDGEFFNEVMKLCLVEVVPILHTILKLPEEFEGRSCNPEKSKVWKKVVSSLKSYLIDIIKILSIMSEPSNLMLVLKHVIHLIPFYLPFVKLSRILIKKMISLWSSSEETVRVFSLLVIVRITRKMSKEYQESILKQMYFEYVRNTKYTSASTWPLISFMKSSLVEVYSLNPEIAYEHAFVYIRQLSIHLRNAITMKKKEAYQTVYNWQYIHCIMHWARLLSNLYDNNAIKSLIYPLVQNIIGTINLIPTTKYVPLRVHLIQVLTQISKTTGVFISVAPLILETLNLIDFNKKSSFSKKPINMSCALKASKSQLQEAGFKDAAMEEVCILSLDYFNIYAHTIGFPELVLPAIITFKSFLKKCKPSKYTLRLKIVLGKFQNYSNYITEKRKSFSYKITNEAEVKRWENCLLQQEIPFVKDFESNILGNSKMEPLKKKRKLNNQ